MSCKLKHKALSRRSQSMNLHAADCPGNVGRVAYPQRPCARQTLHCSCSAFLESLAVGSKCQLCAEFAEVWVTSNAKVLLDLVMAVSSFLCKN